MIVFRLAGGRFPLNPEPPQREKNLSLGKSLQQESNLWHPNCHEHCSIMVYHLADQNGPTKTFPMARTYLYSLYKGEPPPRGGGGRGLLFVLYVFWCRRSILLIRYAVIFAWFCLCFWGWFWPITYNFVCETSTWHLDSWPPGYTWYGVIL